MKKPPVGKRVTIQDVALASGVCKATVSQALVGKGNFSPRTREVIRLAARRLNYEPNPHAQRLSNGRCDDMIALFTMGLDLNVGTTKVRLLQSLLTDAGFDVPIHASATGCSSPAQARLMKSLRFARPRAIVCCTNGLLPAAMRELQIYQDEGGLVVTYDHTMDLPCDQVVFDREDNTYRATRHLLELGHRAIALVGTGVQRPGLARYDGYVRALSDFGITPQSQWVVDSDQADDIYRGMYEEGGVLAALEFLKLNPRPSAACVLDDSMAIGFAAQLGREGVRVPEDVSIVGHDDIPIARFGPLQLTTVTHPVQSIASSVFELLQGRLRGEDGPPREIRVRGELVVRESAVAVRARKSLSRDA